MAEKLFASREVECKGLGKVQVYMSRTLSQLETNLDKTSLEENLRARRSLDMVRAQRSLSQVMEPGAVAFAVVPAEEAVERISINLRSVSFCHSGSTVRKWPVAACAQRWRSRSVLDSPLFNEDAPLLYEKHRRRVFSHFVARRRMSRNSEDVKGNLVGQRPSDEPRRRTANAAAEAAVRAQAQCRETHTAGHNRVTQNELGGSDMLEESLAPRRRLLSSVTEVSRKVIEEQGPSSSSLSPPRVLPSLQPEGFPGNKGEWVSLAEVMASKF